ncbi:hypothetical protein ABPG74_018841 [Tetrahymena malaccensis]
MKEFNFEKKNNIKASTQNQQQTSNQTKHSIEFKFGEPVGLSGHIQLNNKIQTELYSKFNLFPRCLLQYLLKRPVHILIVCYLIGVITADPDVYLYTKSQIWLIFFLPLLLSIALYTFNEHFIDKQRQKRDEIQNNRLCKCFTRLIKNYSNLLKKLREDISEKIKDEVSDKLDQHLIREVKWGELEVGDIVFLKIGEVAPADLVLLDSEDDYACIDTSQMNGDTNIKTKTPFHLTESKRNSGVNNNPFEFRKMLSGKIEYGKNKPDLNNFEAFIKLKKHPNWETITSDNFIPRGSKLTYTDWVYGMVVYVGLNTKFYLKQLKNENSSLIPAKYWSLDETKQQIYFICLYLVMIAFFIVNVIISTSSFYIEDDPFSQKVSYSKIRSQNLQIEFFNMINMLPVYYFLVIDFINFLLLLQKRQAQNRDQNVEPESQNLQIQSDPMKLTQISQMSHVFLHKNTSISTGKLNVRTIGFGNNILYQFKNYESIKEYVEKNKNSFQRMKNISEMEFKQNIHEQSESDEEFEFDDNTIVNLKQSLYFKEKTSSARLLTKRPYDGVNKKTIASLNSDTYEEVEQPKKLTSITNQSSVMKLLKIGEQNSYDASNNVFDGTRMSNSVAVSKFCQPSQANGFLLSFTQNKIIERSQEVDLDQSEIIHNDPPYFYRGYSERGKKTIHFQGQKSIVRKARMSQTVVKSKKSKSLGKYFAKVEQKEMSSDQNSTTRSAQDQNSFHLIQDQKKNQNGQPITYKEAQSLMNTDTNNKIENGDVIQTEEITNMQTNLVTPKNQNIIIPPTQNSENKSPNQNTNSCNELITLEKNAQNSNQKFNFLKINNLQNEADKTFSQNTISNYNNINNTNEENREKKDLFNPSENNHTNEIIDDNVNWQNQSITKHQYREKEETAKTMKNLYRSQTSNNNFISQNHIRNNSLGMTASQNLNKEERFFSPFKNPHRGRGSGRSPILIPQIYNNQDILGRKKNNQNQNSNHTKRNFEIHYIPSYDVKEEKDYLDSLFHPDDHIHNEILIAMSLCQMTRSRYDIANKQIMNFHQTPEEEAINQFISNFNVSLKCKSEDSNNIKYVVQFLNFYSNYQILAIMEPSKNRKRFSILVRDPNSFSSESKEGSILYVRQELDITKSIPSNFNLTISQIEQVDKTFKNMLLHGNQVIIYGKREFTESETQSIIQSYDNLYNNVVVDENIIENLFDQMENELDLLCLVGLEEEILPDVKETIEMIEQRKVKLNLFSSDKINKALPLGFNMGLLTSMSKLTFLTSSDPESLKYDIKEQIKEITISLKDGQNYSQKSKRQSLNSSLINRKSLQNRRVSIYSMSKTDYLKNFMIIVTQQSLRVIMEDDFLKQHFAFVYYFSKGLIGCELTNEQKNELYSLIRMMSQEDCKIISIGQDNINNDADINIETRETYKINCDARVFSFKGLQELLFYTSRLLLEMYDQILLFTLNRCLIVGFLWLIIRSTQQNDMMISFRQTIFYHLPFYLFGIFNILVDKGCVPWISQFYHKNPQKELEPNLSLNFITQTQAPLKSDQFLKYRSLTYKEFQIKSEQDFRLISSFWQFSSAQSYFQYTALLKKFIASCLITALIEVGVFVFCIYFFGSLQMVSGQILPTQFSIRALFLVFNWVGQIRIALNSYNYTFKQFIISFLFIFGISIIYIFVDVDSQEQAPINEAWGSPELWFLMVTILCFQTLFMIAIQTIEIKYLFIGIDLLRDLTISQFNKILMSAQEIKLKTGKKIDSSSFNLMIFIKKLFANVDMDLTIQQLLNPENSLVNNTKINRFTLSFVNDDAQKRFEEEAYPFCIKYSNLSFYTYFFNQVYFLVEYNSLIIDSIVKGSANVQNAIQERVYLAIYIFLNFIILVQHSYFYCLSSKTKTYDQLKGVLLRMSIVRLLLYIEIVVICQSQKFIAFFILLLYSNVYFTTIPIHLIFFQNMILIIVYITLKTINLLENQNYSLIVFQPFIIFSFFIFIISQKYFFQKRQKKNFIQQYELNIQNKKINDVLEILLPKFIINRIKSNDPNKPFRFQEKQGEASIIFCDICHFDDIIKEKNEKIIPFLDKVFKNFDQFCARQGLQKIETVGKTYMASAGLKDFEDQVDIRQREVDPVERAANLALEMLEYVKDLKWSQNGKNLELKIGIHYGQVIAGVIGHHKPQFSLIGDTVNTTSRVCSKGNPSEVTISQEAFQKIQGKTNQFYFSDPKTVFAKGKGDITLYTLKKFNPAIHKKRQTILKPTKLKEDIPNLKVLPPITSLPAQFKKRSQKRSLTTKYNMSNNDINLVPPSGDSKEKILEKRKTTAISKINNLKTEQNLNNSIRSKNKTTYNQDAQQRSQRSQTNEKISSNSKIIQDNNIHNIHGDNQVVISPTSPLAQNTQSIRNKNMSSFHKQNQAKFNSHSPTQNENVQENHQANREFQAVRMYRQDSIKLAVIPFNRENEDENSPTREIYKRTLNIQSPLGANSNSNGKFKRQGVIHSGTFYATQVTQQQNNQPNNQNIQNSNQNGGSKLKLTLSGFQQNKSQAVQTHLNSQMLTESLHNLRSYVIGHPIKQGQRISQQYSAVSQLATDCKEDIYLKCLQKYQENFKIDLKRAQQFLLNDKDDENRFLEGQQDFYVLSIRDVFYKTQDEEAVDEFYANLVESQQQNIKYYLGLVLAICFLKTLSLILILLNESYNQKIVGADIGYRSGLLILIILFIVKNQQIIQSDRLEQFRIAEILTFILFILILIVSTFEIVYYQNYYFQIQILEQIIYFIIFANLNYFRLVFKSLLTTSTIITITIGQILSGTQEFKSYLTVYYFYMYTLLLHAYKYYLIFSLQVQNYNTMRILDSKKQQKDNLVRNLIPKHLLDYFNVKSIAQQTDLCDVFEEATLLFADITDFTKYCSMRNPEEVVNMLSNLFLKFDMKCQELKCFKVYTIGDCYVVLGVDNAKERNPAKEANNVVQMGLNMLDIIKQVRQEVNFETLNMRIGIHTGQIIGGITGSDIVRYDIYGTDVMLSNKMESNGEPGKIMVSQTTKDLLESAYGSYYQFQEGNQVHDIQGYFIQRRSESESNLLANQYSQHQYYEGEHPAFIQDDHFDELQESENKSKSSKQGHINQFGDEIIGDYENEDNYQNNQEIQQSNEINEQDIQIGE